MQVFLDYCYNTISRHSIPNKIPREASPDITTIEYNCCNLCCLNQTTTLRTWKHIKYHHKRLYFCTENCWQQWLNTPSQIGSWSPPALPKEQLQELEAFELDQMTIESNGGED